MTLRVPVTAQDHIAGSLNAPLTLLEYGDYQCPYCANADLVVRTVRQEFGDNLCFAYRSFPLVEMHPAAESAAEFAEGAARQKKFWEAHDALYAWARRHGSPSLAPDAFMDIAGKLGLAEDELEEAIVEHRFLERIKQDFDSGVRSGVNGTPTFFINGRRFEGAPTAEGLSAALNELL